MGQALASDRGFTGSTGVSEESLEFAPIGWTRSHDRAPSFHFPRDHPRSIIRQFCNPANFR
jgi:hypothetical protein